MKMHVELFCTLESVKVIERCQLQQLHLEISMKTIFQLFHRKEQFAHPGEEQQMVPLNNDSLIYGC